MGRVALISKAWSNPKVTLLGCAAVAATHITKGLA